MLIANVNIKKAFFLVIGASDKKAKVFFPDNTSSKSKKS
jgi:hypothetical protein